MASAAVPSGNASSIASIPIRFLSPYLRTSTIPPSPSPLLIFILVKSDYAIDMSEANRLLVELKDAADAAVLAVASTPEGVTIGVQAEGGDVPADVAVDHRTADATWVIPA